MKEASTKEHIQVLQAYEEKIGIEKEMRDWPLNFGVNINDKETEI